MYFLRHNCSNLKQMQLRFLQYPLLEKMKTLLPLTLTYKSINFDKTD